MNRRHFLQLSSVSLAGLMVKIPALVNEPDYLLRFPDKVFVQSGDRLLELASADKSKWIIQELEVRINKLNNTLNVTVSSPLLHLSSIRLNWEQPLNNSAKFLGDHWERTYGDVSWSAPATYKKIPWYFLQYDGETTSCFGVKTGANCICCWNILENGIALTMDTRSGGKGVQLGERKLHAASVITTAGRKGERPFTTGQRFCSLMCDKPRLPVLPVYGINDWYFAYGNNSSALIMQHTNLLAPLATDINNRPFSVIDAGWAKYSPLLPKDCCWQDDFSKSNENFKDMALLAGKIKKAGMRPGLWTRPLCGAHDDAKNLMLPVIPGRNDPKKPVLDPTIEENIERIKRNILAYREWGFELVKHDFTTFDLLGKWGFEMADSLTTPGWHFNDSSKTSAEIILHLYRSIRQAAGSMYLIGCNTLSHLSAGIFELNRIGDDTSGNEWERTKKMGINTLAFRGIQHNNFYAADADCVGLTNKISWLKNKQWMQLLAGSGTPLLISAQPDAVGTEQKAFIKKCFALAAKKLPAGEPLDWMNTFTPAKWKLNGEVVDFDWS